MTKLTIERLGAAGDGIGTIEGTDIYAPFTVPGEVVEGEIIEGRMPNASILKPSADRVKAPCPHFRSCGGCATQHIREEVLADWKRETVRTALERVGLSPELPPTLTSPHRSRRRAVFAGRRTKNGAMVGFHARQSDVIIPLRDCVLVLPQVFDTLPALEELTRLGASRKSVLRLSVTATAAGPDVDVGGARPLDRSDHEALARIAQSFALSRLSWDGEVIVSPATPAIRMGRAEVTPPPGAFLQATQAGEDALVAEVRQAVGKAKSVVDLFSGCGTFTLPLTQSADVHAVEGSRAMLRALDHGWRHGSGLRKVTTETRDLFRNPLLSDELNRFAAIVLDPPRAGAKAQVAQIMQSTVKTVAYVSCNPSTFARDAAALTGAGFTLSRVQVVDQFLWSGHTELAATFVR